MARTPSGRRTARRADRKPLPLSAQRGSDEPAGGDRDAESVGVTASLYGHYHQLQLRNFDGIAGIPGRALAGKKGRSAGVYAARLFSPTRCAYARSRSACPPGHPVYGLPERRSADIGAPCDPLPPAPDAEGRMRLVVQDSAMVLTGSGILRRGALLRQFAGRTARLRHAQGTRNCGGTSFRTGFTPPRSAPADS